MCSCYSHGRRPLRSWLKHGLLFCFHSTWKKNKIGLMKNTHGKCFIISSSSPTEIWHHSVFRKNFSRPLSLSEYGYRRLTLCHFLSDHFRGICSYFLPASSWPQHWPHAPTPMLCLLNHMEHWAGYARNSGAPHTHISETLQNLPFYSGRIYISVRKTPRVQNKLIQSLVRFCVGGF